MGGELGGVSKEGLASGGLRGPVAYKAAPERIITDRCPQSRCVTTLVVPHLGHYAILRADHVVRPRSSRLANRHPGFKSFSPLDARVSSHSGPRGQRPQYSPWVPARFRRARRAQTDVCRSDPRGRALARLSHDRIRMPQLTAIRSELDRAHAERTAPVVSRVFRTFGRLSGARPWLTR